MSIRQRPAHFCDLCDTEHDPAELRRVRSERRSEAAAAFKSVGVDVCGPCRSRSIDDLLAAIDRGAEHGRRG
jgi:hypothetical protein